MHLQPAAQQQERMHRALVNCHTENTDAIAYLKQACKRANQKNVYVPN